MSERATIHLTEAEFRRHLNAAVERGIRAALESVAGFCRELSERQATTPPTATSDPAGTSEQEAS